MNMDLMATPPSRKPSQHHGMADRKPIKYHPIANMQSCSRRLFVEQVHIKTVQEDRPIRSLRF